MQITLILSQNKKTGNCLMIINQVNA